MLKTSATGEYLKQGNIFLDELRAWLKNHKSNIHSLSFSTIELALDKTPIFEFTVKCESDNQTKS